MAAAVCRTWPVESWYRSPWLVVKVQYCHILLYFPGSTSEYRCRQGAIGKLYYYCDKISTLSSGPSFIILSSIRIVWLLLLVVELLFIVLSIGVRVGGRAGVDMEITGGTDYCSGLCICRCAFVAELGVVHVEM